MRVLIIARDYPGTGLDAPSAALACDALTQTGHDVLVVAGEARGPADARLVTAAEYPPVMAGFDERAWLLQLNIAIFERAAAALEDEPADVVHAFGTRAAHAGASVRRAFGLPLVVSISPGRGDAGVGAWLAAGAADEIVVASRRSAAALAGSVARIRVVRGGPGYARRLVAVYREAIHAGLSSVSG